MTATLQWRDRFVTDAIKPGRLLAPSFMPKVGLNEHERGTQSLRWKKVSVISEVISNLRAIRILRGNSNIDDI